jgi:hypothetical protein
MITLEFLVSFVRNKFVKNRKKGRCRLRCFFGRRQKCRRDKASAATTNWQLQRPERSIKLENRLEPVKSRRAALHYPEPAGLLRA